MKKINETKSLGELISAFTFENSKGKSVSLSHIIKQSTIFSFWNDIVGTKFAKFSKPLAIKYNTLYVSAKSPVVVSELNFCKAKILEKLNSYSNALGIKIKDIKFDYKNFNSKVQTHFADETKPVWYKKEDLDEIELDENYKSEIKEAISKIRFLNEEQRKTLLDKIFQAQKAKIKRNKS